MRYRPDIAVNSPDGRSQLVVEVKGVPNKSADWAAALRHNLTTGVPLSATPFFLLALPDHLYFWKNDRDPSPRRPDVALETSQVLQDYLPPDQRERHLWRESELELVIAAWLDDLTRNEPRLVNAPWASALAETGLLDAIRGGEVRVGAAA